MSNWLETVWNGINWFFNQPVPIIGCTVASLLISVLVIVSKTSIGKKSLNKMKMMFEQIDTEYKDYKNKAEKQIEELTKMYESKLAIIEEKKEQTEELIIAIAECLPNKKVKEVLSQYEIKPQVEEISDVVKAEVEKVEKSYDILLRRIEALENGEERKNG